MLLATALCSGLNLRRGQQLSRQLGVPVRTIERWRQWWLTRFTLTAVWRCLCGRFLPVVSASDLPGALLDRVVAANEREAVAAIMGWLAPLSTFTEGR